MVITMSVHLYELNPFFSCLQGVVVVQFAQKWGRVYYALIAELVIHFLSTQFS